MAVPLISDLELRRRFQSGDRIIARSAIDIPSDKQKAIARAISKSAGADVRLLFVNCARLIVTLDLPDGGCIPLANPSHVRDIQRGSVVNMQCSAVYIPDDSIMNVTIIDRICVLDAYSMYNEFRRWSGDKCEVSIYNGVVGPSGMARA